MLKPALTVSLLLAATGMLTGCGWMHTERPSATSFVCAAQNRWQSTGVTLAAGDRFRITWQDGLWTPTITTGLYSPGGNPRPAKPGSPLPTAPDGAMIGRVGTDIFLIGDDVETVATQSGTLYCSINDTIISAYGRGLEDNQGKVTMRITTSRWQDRADCGWLVGCDTLWPGRWVDPAAGRPLN